MSWFRVDDKAAFNAKVLRAGNEAFGALTRMGCWSSDHLTDGRIPIETASLIATEQTLQRLCKVGFLEEDGGDFIIHDFLDYNPTSVEVKADRARKAEARAKAGKSGGIASGVARRSNSEANAKQEGSKVLPAGEANAKQNEAPSRPVPFETQKDARAGVAAGPPAITPNDFRVLWGTNTGEHMPDAWQLGEVRTKLEGYAVAVGKPFGEVADAAHLAFVAEIETWDTGRPLTAKLFNSKWGEIQGRMGGKVPTGKGKRAGPSNGRPPEPPPREYEDLGEAIRRTTGEP